MTRIRWKRVQSELSKGRPINLRLKTHAPESIVADIFKRWGQWIEFGPVDNEWVSLASDAGFKKFLQEQTPGAWLAGLRGAHGLTQKKLGEKLGNVKNGEDEKSSYSYRILSEVGCTDEEYSKVSRLYIKEDGERIDKIYIATGNPSLHSTCFEIIKE